MTTNKPITLQIVDDDYAWSCCQECGNTIKFGPGKNPITACPGCGTRHTADRSEATVSVDFVPTDDEFWEEMHAE